jgi:predicted RNA-binding Zn ribbon-like protein
VLERSSIHAEVFGMATPAQGVVFIADGPGLATWLRRAGILSVAALRLICADKLAHLDAAAAEIRNLREWYRRFVRSHMGRPLEPADLRDLDKLNRILARETCYPQIVAVGGNGEHLKMSTERGRNSPDALLLVVAEMIARDICELNFTHVRACRGAKCSFVFLDNSRGLQRRWCSMAGCGNRAKQDSLRSRAKRKCP